MNREIPGEVTMRFQVRDLMLKVSSDPEPCPSTQCPPGCGCTNVESCPPDSVETPQPIQARLSVLRDQMHEALLPA